MPKNAILYGSSGTGKTVLLVECVKMKVASLVSQGKFLKIIVSTYHPAATRLLQELQKNYSLEYLTQHIPVKHKLDYSTEISFKTLEELFKGA